MSNQPDIRVEPLDESGRPHPPGADSRPRTDTIGGQAGGGLVDRLTLPMLRRLRDRPPPSLIAAVAALLGGAAVALYIGQPAEDAGLPGPVLTRPIVQPETWLGTEVSGAHNVIQSSRHPREDWEFAIAEHPPEAILVLPVDSNRQLLGLPPGRFQMWGSCDTTELEPEPEPGDELPRVTVWVRHPDLLDDEPGMPLTCDGGLYPLAVIEDSAEYRPFEAYGYFMSPDPNIFDPDLGMVVVSFTVLR